MAWWELPNSEVSRQRSDTQNRTCTDPLVIGPVLFPLSASAEAIPAELRKAEEGCPLLRGVEPYLIGGAGGDASLQPLAAAGTNSIRK